MKISYNQHIIKLIFCIPIMFRDYTKLFELYLDISELSNPFVLLIIQISWMSLNFTFYFLSLVQEYLNSLKILHKKIL